MNQALNTFKHSLIKTGSSCVEREEIYKLLSFTTSRSNSTAPASFRSSRILMCAEKTGGFNLVNYRHSSGVYHEQETEDLHRRI